MPPLSAHLRLYCERTGDQLFGEPLNAISNIGFFIAGWFLLRLYQRQKSATGSIPHVATLIALVFIIGAGSLLFHAVGTMWAAIFDVIPIAFFIFFYLYAFARNLLGLNRLRAWGLLLCLVGVNIAYKFYVFRAMDGYVSYIPTFFFLAGLCVFMLIQRHPSALRILVATTLALVSLYCRTIDRDICNALPIGTHFLWHGFNALVIYILVRELITHAARKT